MKVLTVYYKNLILFALLFVTIHSVAIPIKWEAVVRDAERTRNFSVFEAIFNQQDGHSFYYYYTLLSGGQQEGIELNNLGIRADGCPISPLGHNLVWILAEALIQQRFQNSLTDRFFRQMTEEAVAFGAFPLHWLSQLTGSPNGFVLDSIHYIGQNITYVNLQPARENSNSVGDPASESGDNFENHLSIETEPSFENGNVEVSEGVANDAFENKEDSDNPKAGLAAARTKIRSVVGVILQEYTNEELQKQTKEHNSSPYRLIVIPQMLDDETVSAILNNTSTAERRVHFETRLNRETLLDLSRSTQSEQNLQVFNEQPEASQEERSYFRVFLQYVLMHCFCCCIASGSFRVNPH